MDVYFISGMCVNCKVFKKIELPCDYIKHYIEWIEPEECDSLNDYARKMASSIDTGKPFVLIGYSFGGIIIQEMNQFIKPEKNIIISSIKDRNEIPNLFKIAKASHILKHIPAKLYSINETISNLFARTLYKMTEQEVSEYVSYTSSSYMKWSTYQITNWEPVTTLKNLYHIHGTKDQIFSSENIKNAYIVEEGDHLMILRKSDKINEILSGILS